MLDVGRQGPPPAPKGLPGYAYPAQCPTLAPESRKDSESTDRECSCRRKRRAVAAWSRCGTRTGWEMETTIFAVLHASSPGAVRLLPPEDADRDRRSVF